MKTFISGIYIIKRESYIKAKVIRIKTIRQCHIEESIRLANNGISAMLSSHGLIEDGYQMFLQGDTDGELICQKIIDALLPLIDDRVVLERINC
jgi:hypothetical protein